MADLDEKTAELVEEKKITPTAARNLDLEEEKRLKPEVKKLLKMFEEAGYQTHRGTNSYLLANIIVDYTQRILLERANTMTYLNYWETDDIAVLAPLAFSRYRIYNMRSSGTIYQAVNSGPVGQTYQGAVRISDSEFMQGAPVMVNLGNPNHIGKSLPLKIAYSDLLSGGSLVVSQTSKDFGEPDFFESFMDEDGRYIEQDYIILPDEDGQAVFIPTEFFLEKVRKIEYPKGTNAKLLVFTRREDINPDLTPIRDAIVIDCDYLRFITSELMAKFTILNRMSIESFTKFLKLRYNATARFEGNVIYADLPTAKQEEVLDFARRNVIAPVGQEWEIKEMGRVTVVVESYSEDRESEEMKSRLAEIVKYLKDKIGGVADPHEIESMANYFTDEFYRERYGYKGIKEKETDGVYSYVKFEDNYGYTDSDNSYEHHDHYDSGADSAGVVEHPHDHDHHPHDHDHHSHEHGEDCGCDVVDAEMEYAASREGFYLVEVLTADEVDEGCGCAD